MLHPDYFPFTEEQLLSHFAQVRKNGRCIKNVRHLEYYKKSVKRYSKYIKDNPDRRTKPIKDLEYTVVIHDDPKEKLKEKSLHQSYQCAIQLLNSGKTEAWR